MTREEAVARIKDHMSVHKIHEERAVKITEALNMAIKALEQPEIVRCKDCICAHSEVWLSGGGKSEAYACGYCGKTNLKILPYDFCSRPERRTDEGSD